MTKDDLPDFSGMPFDSIYKFVSEDEDYEVVFGNDYCFFVTIIINAKIVWSTNKYFLPQSGVEMIEGASRKTRG